MVKIQKVFLITHRKSISILFIATILNLSGCAIHSKKDIVRTAPSAPEPEHTAELLLIPDPGPPIEKPGIESPNRQQNNRQKATSYVIAGKRYYIMSSSDGYRQEGIASWYGRRFHGRKTANGERYNMYAMTAAHTGLPISTYVKVTNLKNYRTIVVRINDRGPFHGNRIIDLSYAAARKLGFVSGGVSKVEVRAISKNKTLKYRHQSVTLNN